MTEITPKREIEDGGFYSQVEVCDLLRVSMGTLRAWRTLGLRLPSGEVIKLSASQTVGQKAKLWYLGSAINEFVAKVRGVHQGEEERTVL